MSSLRRIASSRGNGAKSRGPKTPDTRQVSAMNAVNHGLTAKTIVLENESQDRFQQVLDAYLRRYRPQDEVEADLVEEIVAAKWRQRRLWSIETASLNIEMNRQEANLRANYSDVQEPDRMALAFKSLADGSTGPHLLNRYEASLRHASERALIALQFLQSQLPNEPSPANEQPVEIAS